MRGSAKTKRSKTAGGSRQGGLKTSAALRSCLLGLTGSRRWWLLRSGPASPGRIRRVPSHVQRIGQKYICPYNPWQGPKLMATSKIILRELYAHMNCEELIILHVSSWVFPMSVIYTRHCWGRYIFRSEKRGSKCCDISFDVLMVKMSSEKQIERQDHLRTLLT